MSEFVGPASALAVKGYVCTVRPDDGTEVLSDGSVFVEVWKSRVESSVPLPLKSQPFASLLLHGGYSIRLDESDHLEIFEGSYFDEDMMQSVAVKCHVSRVTAVRPSDLTHDRYVELGGSGISSRLCS